jgi:regulator of replication initiation timing
MTDNQEKQLFKTLETLVTGVNKIQSDVQGLKTDVKEIKVTLNEHSQILNEHSQILKRLDAKTDSIAETVMKHENRLTKA